jgi:hypothetical protein
MMGMDLTLATDRDEAALRRLLRAQAMPGWVRLTYEREPDFFTAAAIQGDGQVIAARQNGQIVGMGCRSWRDVYVNGQPARVGYLSGLRSLESARNRLGLARGYAFLRKLHADRRVSGYLTTIVEANRDAARLLTSQRAGLPGYRDLGRLMTYVLPLTRRGSSGRASRVMPVESVNPGGFDEVIHFLNEVGRRRQFFPVVQAGDFGQALWRGLGPESFLVARNPDRSLAGVVAGWDQTAFKQHRVAGYANGLAQVRWLCNAGLRLADLPRLPEPGSVLRLLHLSLLCVRDDRPATLAALLDALDERWRLAGFEFACVAFHERDPLTAVLRGRRALRYRSRLYWVEWSEEASSSSQFDPSFVPHIEVAAL